MLFNSAAFVLFFCCVYALYLALRSHHRWQNWLLLLSSYLFYASWDWRFLSLIWISTLIDYVSALKIARAPSEFRRKRWLILSVAANLLVLGTFKYFNFFTDSLALLIGQFGFSLPARFSELILPVGISFYTFQTMSYTIDVYRGKQRPTRRLDDFALFVAFFPQLVAGPIERASRLLPQIERPRRVTLQGVFDGCWLMLWGLFEKVVVADNLVYLSDAIFNNPGPHHGLTVLLGLYALVLHIYYDFAGYSDIARGLGKCLGIELMVNFRFPYFTTDPTAFWRRWHISLSTWFRDYVYRALGGRNGGAGRRLRNVVLTFALAGLWHGASWTFVLWGIYHAILLVAYLGLGRSRPSSTPPQGFHALWRGLLWFHLWTLGSILFGSGSLGQAGHLLRDLFTGWHGTDMAWVRSALIHMAAFLSVPVTVEWFQRNAADVLGIHRWPWGARTILYVICMLMLMIYGVYGEREFVYFQF